MVALKGRAVDQFLQRPDRQAACILVYGPDTGLVSERGRMLADALRDSDDDLTLVTLEADMLAADPARLADEAHAIGLFGGRRVVRVRAGTSDVSRALKPILATPPADCAIIVEAGDLRPSSPLRKLFETDSTALAIACYADAERDLARLVDDMVREAGLSVTPPARALLLQNLGGDRLASRMEIEKLCLYAAGAGQIDVEHIDAILGDVSSLRLDDIVDAAAEGLGERLVSNLARMLAAGGDAGVVAAAAYRHFDLLLKLRLADEAGRSLDQAIGTLRPPLHFRRRDAVKRQAQRWSLAALRNGVDRLYACILAARRNPALAPEITERALLDLARRAGTRR